MPFPVDVNALGSVSGSQTLAAAGHATRHNEVKTALEGIRDALGGTAVPSGTVQPILAAGSASAPSLSFTGDSNTGLWSPGASTVAVSTGGVERLRIGSDGNTFGVAAQNLLYNGAMQVAQRATSVAGINADGYYTADRWFVLQTTLGTWTQSVENDAPTGSGFRKSLKMLVTTNKASPSAGDYFAIQQRIEGQDLQAIRKGTTSAQQVALSFWVKANVTGTFIAEIYDVDNTRQVSASYTISASATWERKTITFPADTTGAFDNDNARSLDLVFWLGAGSTFTSGTLQTTWASATNANRAVGQTNLAAATNNYWQVTGVQLEVGPIASPFQFKSYGQELRECQRYYFRTTADTAYSYMGFGMATSTTAAKCQIPLPVVMRATPGAIDCSAASAFRFVDGVSAAQLNVAPALDADCTNEIATVNGSVASGLTQYRPYWIGADNSATAYIGFSAEL